MSHMKHTPGPWSYNQDEGGSQGHCISTEEYVICDLWDGGDGAAPHTEANARLIAASPDLLEALEFSAEYLEFKGCYKALEKAHAAIAKAKGGAS